MNNDEQKKLAYKIYNNYAFILMETDENFADFYKAFKFRLFREDEDITNDEREQIWEKVIYQYVKDCNKKGKFDGYQYDKEERKTLIQDATLCLHKLHNEDLRSIIYENELRDIEHYELDGYWGISQKDLIVGYDKNKTNMLIDAYQNIEENKETIEKNIAKLSPMAIVKMMEILKEDKVI